MMQPEVRRERVEKYGSFLFCPKRETICFHINTPEGICERQICCKDDPEYIKQQNKIEENRRKNAEKEHLEREAEKLDPPTPIRRQTKSKIDLLEKTIAAKEKKAQQLYRSNKPKLADSMMQEVMILRRQLKQTKGRRYIGR